MITLASSSRPSPRIPSTLHHPMEIEHGHTTTTYLRAHNPTAVITRPRSAPASPIFGTEASLMSFDGNSLAIGTNGYGSQMHEQTMDNNTFSLHPLGMLLVEREQSRSLDATTTPPHNPAHAVSFVVIPCQPTNSPTNYLPPFSHARHWPQFGHLGDSLHGLCHGTSGAVGDR